LINEVDADTDGTDTAEFIELISPSGGNFPLDGYSLVFYNGSDDASYLAYDLDGMSTNAEGYFVLCGDGANVANCDMDVTPDSNLLQNGADAVALVYGDAADYPNDTPVSTVNLVDAAVYDTDDSDDAGLLVLLNSGQPQLNENGAANKDAHSNQRCPDGYGGARNTTNYIQALATPGAINNCGPLEIWDIQGATGESVYAGFNVVTANNIVTAVGPEGFFIQTPDARADGSSDTSNGIYVFTGETPIVAVGDDVDVSGRVDEFFGFTELTGSPVVTVNSSGNALPAPVVFGANIPSSDPLSPSCAIEYECYEGMLVRIDNGTATGGNLSFSSDPIAEVPVTAVNTRTYREPGLLFPGVGGSIPTWDGNPEVFELDPDKLGLPNLAIPGGSGFSATGVLAYEFGDYELWPTSLSVDGAAMPRSVRDRNDGEMMVGSLNLFRFATDGEYSTRLAKLSLYIRTVLMSPDVLAVQEADSLDALQDLASQIAADDEHVSYTPYLLEGNDFGGIDVGFLVRSSVDVDAVTQLGADEIFDYDQSLLHDRPPLLLEGRYTGNGAPFPVAVMVIHNRSLNSIETERVQLKRLAQAESIAAMAQGFQTANLLTPLLVVGDYNAYEFTDGYADVVGHIMGDFNAAESLQSGQDLVDPNLNNLIDSLPAEERYSYVFEGNAQALDHALASQSADLWLRGMQYGRGNADAAENLITDPSTALASSDHDGLVVYLMTDYDGDGVADDNDACPMNGDRVDWNPELGCEEPIPTLDPRGLLLLLLLLGGLGIWTIRRNPGLSSS
jgi:predicted extracellular nuclease